MGGKRGQTLKEESANITGGQATKDTPGTEKVKKRGRPPGKTDETKKRLGHEGKEGELSKGETRNARKNQAKNLEAYFNKTGQEEDQGKGQTQPPSTNNGVEEKGEEMTGKGMTEKEENIQTTERREARNQEEEDGKKLQEEAIPVGGKKKIPRTPEGQSPLSLKLNRNPGRTQTDGGAPTATQTEEPWRIRGDEDEDDPEEHSTLNPNTECVRRTLLTTPTSPSSTWAGSLVNTTPSPRRGDEGEEEEGEDQQRKQIDENLAKKIAQDVARKIGEERGGDEESMEATPRRVRREQEARATVGKQSETAGRMGGICERVEKKV
ncbi:cyclic nucleotide-gated cation channel beta-1-like [Fopius arisanus]|uniref:Cyclic nucleotide-gated cation channel beta-1-like n=1 Tax=Fopius arisanus TaxID=64838 RepID=A0A9R1TLS2_9HYME|nr:PREDICTED: cyclic nucleotide-gated cation channel beta-1-like [Fopius arisanus]